MKFNATKSMTMVFMPHETARRVLSTFPNFTLSGVPLNVVDSCKYLGHIISSVNDDNQDIARQMRLLYARANMLIRKFSKSSRDVKLCLFRAYLWSPYVIGRPYIFSCCGLFLLLSFFSSPNLSGRRLDVYHTLAHGVALVRI